MKKIFSYSLLCLCWFLLLATISRVNGKPNGKSSRDTISAKFNGKWKNFNFLTNSESADNNSLLTINGFTENDSLSPSLELHLSKLNGKITPGNYYLDADPNQSISAQYTIERAKDGAVLTNTVYETRDIGKKTDLIIMIKSLANGRAKGTFSGVITTEEEVKGDKVITITEGKFDVRLKSQ